MELCGTASDESKLYHSKDKILAAFRNTCEDIQHIENMLSHYDNTPINRITLSKEEQTIIRKLNIDPT
jgi:hypothetical protein